MSLTMLLGSLTLLLNSGLALRQRRGSSASTWAECSWIGCFGAFNRSLPCQCNDRCRQYSNCCPDYDAVCRGVGAPPPSPSPSPQPQPTPGPSPPVGTGPPPTQGAAAYWNSTNMRNQAEVQSKLRGGARKLSYGGLWTAYKKVWVDLPGTACKVGIFDVYSSRCWTPGSAQCGNYKKEGDCYNREHSWPKSWWGRAKNAAYSDMFHVMPSDGYVNGRRGSFPFGEVSRPSYTSSEGNKVGPCSGVGYSGTCFEPTDRVKGLLARGSLYMDVRYSGEFTCCSNDAVDGPDMKSWYTRLMLQWHSSFPPQPWEVEFNERTYREQGNRNPFIDYPEAAEGLF